jgi:hypothetical protein
MSWKARIVVPPALDYPLTEGLLSRLRQTQWHLQCEWGMNQVEFPLRKKEQSELIPNYLRALYHQKRHYMLVHLVFKLGVTGSLGRSIPQFFSSILTKMERLPASDIV